MSNAPAKVIVHAGYHKTGTTSLQDFLYDNRYLLAPYLRYYGKNDFRQAGADARIYAQKPFPWRLYRFRQSLRRFLADLPEGRPIVLSRETFSGAMPGHRRIGGAMIRSYHRPARRLAGVIIGELRRRFGQDVDITFFYTTREREDWIRSVHGHLLRSIRLRDDFATFRARFPALSGPEEEARRMAEALAPVPVVQAALEDYRDHPHGLASALLDLVDMPKLARAPLQKARRSNRGQDAALREAFLALNRKGGGRAALKAAKEKLLREAQDG